MMRVLCHFMGHDWRVDWIEHLSMPEPDGGIPVKVHMLCRRCKARP